MENSKKLATSKIEELAGKKAFVTEAEGQVWSKDGGDFIHVLAEPVQASFTKKENKEQVQYTGYVHAVKFAKTSAEDATDVKYNQLLVGNFKKLGDAESTELEVRRTRVTSGEKTFKRIPTKALVAKLNPVESTEAAK